LGINQLGGIVARLVRPKGESKMSSTYKIELSPPDIAPYRRGNTGVDFVTTLDSKKPGPHVMVNALTHGNELCGAIAVDFLFKHDVRPTRGKLTLSFANYEAYQRFDHSDPWATRFVDEDFNRLWSRDVLDGPRDSVELRRARVLRPIVENADILFDIHSMQTHCAALTVAGNLSKGRDLAAAVGYPGHVVMDAGHVAGHRMRDNGGFGDPGSAKNAMLIECGQHWAAAAGPVAIESMLRFLLHLDIIDPGFANQHLSQAPLAPQKFIKVTEAVTISTDNFDFVREFHGLETIPCGHPSEGPGTVWLLLGFLHHWQHGGGLPDQTRV
jgi:predicted deacylase